MTAVLVALVLSCGTERWPVKVMQDEDGQKVFQVWSEKRVRQTSISQLIAMKAPIYDEANPRADPVELTVWGVDALVLAAKQENDEDYHVVIADPANPTRTMIAEIPSPDCLSSTYGPARDAILQARQAFQKLFGRMQPRLRKLKTPLRVMIEGPGFFDKKHGQDGLAPNGVEIHPVLAIRADPLEGAVKKNGAREPPGRRLP